MNVASPSSSPEVSGGDYLALALPGGGAGGATGAVALRGGRKGKESVYVDNTAQVGTVSLLAETSGVYPGKILSGM